jgi:hypothetical protein
VLNHETGTRTSLGRRNPFAPPGRRPLKEHHINHLRSNLSIATPVAHLAFFAPPLPPCPADDADAATGIEDPDFLGTEDRIPARIPSVGATPSPRPSFFSTE